LGETNLLAIVEDAEADAGRLAVLRILDGEVRNLDRGFLGNDAALGLRRLALVTAHDVDATDERAVLLRANLDDLAALAFVAAGQDDDAVALLDLKRGH